MSLQIGVDKYPLIDKITQQAFTRVYCKVSHRTHNLLWKPAHFVVVSNVVENVTT